MGPLEFVIPIVAIVMSHIAIIVFIFLFFSTRHKERMALLEYDRDASVFYGHRLRGSGLLKWGLVIGFCGLGLLVGYFLEEAFHMDEEIAYFSSIMMGAGGGLLLYYWILQRKVSSAPTL